MGTVNFSSKQALLPSGQVGDLSPNTHDHAHIKRDVSDLIKKQLCGAVKAMHTILQLRGCRINHDVVLLHESCPLHDMNVLVRL